MRTRFFGLSLVLLLAPFTAGCQISLSTAEEVVERTVPLEPGAQLSIENVNGSVELTTWDRDEVWIEATKSARALSSGKAEEALSKLDFTVTERGGGLAVEVERPRSSNWLFGDALDTGIDFRVSAPAAAKVRLTTVNGRLEVAEVGEVSARSVNGRIELRKIHGPAEARTVNGSIRADLAAFGDDGDLRLVATNGSIKVSLPSNAGADLDARTTNGTIRSELTVDGEKSRRRLQGTINGGGGRLSLRTTNGSIRVEAG